MIQKVDEENQNISIYSKKRLYLNSINTILNSSFVNQSTLNSLISEMLERVNSCTEEFKLAFEISEDIKYDLCVGGYYDPRTSSITLKIGRNTLFYIYCALNKEAFIDKKFLKEVYGYFEDQSKGKYDYKNWFQSKTPSLNESLLSLI